MELNQSTLRGILAQILSVDEKYIVPKQGNWWNPQTQAESPDTWCAYLIRSNKPRTAPFYYKDNNTNYVVTEKIATIDLQFVGTQSEEVAQSIAMWPLRDDVAVALQSIQGSLLPDDMDARSLTFYQDGANTVLSWNVTIRILWYSVLRTDQGEMPNLVMNGKINK